MSWDADAACRDHDPDLFFVGAGGSTAAAKRVCMGCPVKRECLEDALANEGVGKDERHGIFGAMTPRERQEIHARRRQVNGAFDRLRESVA